MSEPTPLQLRAVKAVIRAERDSFAELDRTFGIADCPQQGASKRAHTRDSMLTFRKLWHWACRRWPDFPTHDYNERQKGRA